VGKTVVIRHRILHVVLLGVLTSAISLVALERALLLTEAQRHERARDAMVTELDRLSRLAPSPESLRQTPTTSYIGLHAGWATGTADFAGLPAAWSRAVADVIGASSISRARVVRERPLGANTLIVAAQPSPTAPTTWVALQLTPSSYLRPWRWIVVVLALATALLVFTAVRGAWVFRKNAGALHATLAALGKDLAAPVPRPTMGELAGIADGIRRLAGDLREARATEARLSVELAQKDRLAALGRVAAGVAHEVRNPLASIKLRLDLTAAAEPLTPTAKLAIEAAAGEIARLDRLVSDLLLVAGQKAGPRRPVELGALVRTRAEALSPWSAARGIDIHVGGSGHTVANPESLARAVDNVLRNAVEASPQAASVEVLVAENDGQVEVRVEDRGQGVEAARAAELFEPFFTTKADGTGLGLAISRAIARAHGGELVYARVGEVTRFSLSLPRVEQRT
jgi:signal transduction histidine kinase